METRATLRRWGNSLGIIIPSEAIQTKQLREGEEITITIGKKDPFKSLFGALKHKKLDAQKIKDQLRDEWSKW
ncbi:hypothetical protein EXS73_01675 [Candidatus Pacearchaeota archaeon]|nr:hypothetical protein [Candidatus Pacearchaeota archaeon]